MHEGGASGAWVTTIGFFIPLAVLLPLALAQWRRTLGGLRQLCFAGFWLALGIALYTEGIVRGQIAHVILLFYLTPMWGTLLARMFLHQPITGRRLATIVLGLAGMLVLFGIDLGAPSLSATADWMGLAAGFSWAVAMVAFNRGAPRPPPSSFS
jgi:drug/metabolite transporter (DMT)-like permease